MEFLLDLISDLLFDNDRLPKPLRVFFRILSLVFHLIMFVSLFIYIFLSDEPIIYKLLAVGVIIYYLLILVKWLKSKQIFFT